MNKSSSLKAVGSFFWELIKVLVIAVIIIVPIRFFLVQPFFVRGASMEPNFFDGEYLVVDELSYRFREPRRGEVVIFRFPENPSQFFIKRIVGLPGDTVSIENGRVVIHNQQFQQGVVLDEASYISGDARTGGQTTIQLTKQEFFVLGDNRAASSDSRSWGPLPRSKIVGRAWIRALPFNKITVFDLMRPGYLSL